MRLINYVSTVFAEKLDSALEGQIIHPIDIEAIDGDVFTLRNGHTVTFQHFPIINGTIPKPNPLGLRLTGASHIWADVLAPMATYLAKHVLEYANGRPLVSALLPLPEIGLGMQSLRNSTMGLFSFRTLLSADFENLSYALSFDAIFGVA